jgi:hypothetical protein
MAQHFLATVPTMKDILQRELEIKQFSRRWGLHSLSDAQNFARAAASEEMVRILQSSGTTDFDGIAASDESSFQYVDPLSSRFARSPADVLDLLPKDMKFNQLDSVHDMFPDLKKRQTLILCVRGQGQLFGSIWTIQCVTTHQKWLGHSRRTISPECPIHPICQTYTYQTFGSWGC